MKQTGVRNLLLVICVLFFSSFVFASGWPLYFLEPNFFTIIHPYSYFMLFGFLLLSIIAIIILKKKTGKLLPSPDLLKGLIIGGWFGSFVALLLLVGFTLGYNIYSLNLIGLFVFFPILITLILGWFFYWTPVEIHLALTLAFFIISHIVFWGFIGFFLGAIFIIIKKILIKK